MTDPEEVRVALARLARGEFRAAATRSEPRADLAREREAHPDRNRERTVDPPDRERVVDRAVRATSDVERAAEYVAAGGLDRLEAAIAGADRHREPTLATRGRAVLATFGRFREACEDAVVPSRHCEARRE